ncbi:hypothetical protein KCG44_10355 [Pacificimonas sp. WHA3]|uniref:Uncharacterized protein n=1 Tax=Pacificimonas pallii TaxID=2827236 RepID=A0ABS6SFJ4_9SPHN|nr:hypothetical protein [Pacificimonas pallii]MBV7257183.1 hypothetical protein [Pacificimonas pallii]
MIHSDQTTPFVNPPHAPHGETSVGVFHGDLGDTVSPDFIFAEGTAPNTARPDSAGSHPAPHDTADPAPDQAVTQASAAAPERLHDPVSAPSDWCPLPRDHPRRWTAERQRLFIETLAETGIVSRAADRAGMSRESAYQLRRRTDRADFRDAWDAATDIAGQMLQEIAFDRVLNGAIETRYDADGEVTGYTRRINDRLLMFMLTHHRPAVYGNMSGAQPYDAWALAEARKEKLPALLNGFHRREQRNRLAAGRQSQRR